jgi:hypothetical protein
MPAWYSEIGQQTLPALPVAHQRRFNMLLCTNITFHRSAGGVPPRTMYCSAHNILNPEFPIDPVVLEDIVEASRLFQNVPPEFPEKA